MAGHKMLSVPRFEQVGAVSVVLVGGIGSCDHLPRHFELVGAVSVVLVGGVDRKCHRQPPPVPVKTRTRTYRCGFQRVRVWVFKNSWGASMYIKYIIILITRYYYIQQRGGVHLLVALKDKSTTRRCIPPRCVKEEWHNEEGNTSLLR